MQGCSHGPLQGVIKTRHQRDPSTAPPPPLHRPSTGPYNEASHFKRSLCVQVVDVALDSGSFRSSGRLRLWSNMLLVVFFTLLLLLLSLLLWLLLPSGLGGVGPSAWADGRARVKQEPCNSCACVHTMHTFAVIAFIHEPNESQQTHMIRDM